MPNVSEVEDPGLPVDDIIDDREKLEQEATTITGEKLVLDQEWETVDGFESHPDVRAVLLQNRAPGGVARVNSVPSKYTLTSRLTGRVLVAAKPGEKLSLIGNPYVLRFRRRPD